MAADAAQVATVAAAAGAEELAVTLCLLAHRIQQLTDQIQDLERRLALLAERHASQLLTVVGIGPDTAVTLLITVGDNPEPLHSEASFAALCGVSPIERSSGARQYRRLNRGGDRQANAALHRIAQTRRRYDPFKYAKTNEGEENVPPANHPQAGGRTLAAWTTT
ncbi:transposase [Streptomyces sp. BP-8]|uniref:Transposase n=1 Tax=Streptomyces sirii TaxID=3127701 RepID=A0ABZ2QGU4_9ACTN